MQPLVVCLVHCPNLQVVECQSVSCRPEPVAVVVVVAVEVELLSLLVAKQFHFNCEDFKNKMMNICISELDDNFSLKLVTIF